MAHIKSVTVIVTDDSGQSFTITESNPGPSGDNPRFVGQQFTTALNHATERAFEIIPAFYGPQQAWPPPGDEMPPMLTTTDIAEAAANIAGATLPHSRACGIAPHIHGRSCSNDCPTCGGREDWAVDNG